MQYKLPKCSLLFLFTLLLVKPSMSQNVAANDSIKSNDSTKSSLDLNVNADIVSRFVWRGSDFGNSPSVQPTLSLSCHNLEVGCWSALATNSYYKEVDLYASYTYKILSLGFTDYYVPYAGPGISSSPDNRYFIYTDKKTAHTFEGSVKLDFGDKCPLWLSSNMFFYGNDKRWGYDAAKDTTNASYYSSYFEVGYTFKIQENSADVYVGFTPAAGAYGNTLGVVNIGITGKRNIKITKDFSLPVQSTLVFNPQSSNVYFVFGISIE